MQDFHNTLLAFSTPFLSQLCWWPFKIIPEIHKGCNAEMREGELKSATGIYKVLINHMNIIHVKTNNYYLLLSSFPCTSTRGSKYTDLTWKLLVFSKSGPLWEVVTTGGSTKKVSDKNGEIKCFKLTNLWCSLQRFLVCLWILPCTSCMDLRSRWHLDMQGILPTDTCAGTTRMGVHLDRLK